MKKCFWGVSLFFLLSACQSNLHQDKLIGTWAIEDFEVKGYEGHNLNGNLDINIIIFEKEHVAQLPKLNDKGYKSGKWYFTKSYDSLIIYSKDNFVSQKYKAVFYRDSVRRLDKLTLTSERIEMKCAKFLSNHEN